MGLIDWGRFASCDAKMAAEIQQACGTQQETYITYDIHYLNIVLLAVALLSLGVMLRREAEIIRKYLARLVAWTKKRPEIAVLAVALIAIFAKVTVDLDNPEVRRKIDSAQYHIEEFLYSEVRVQDQEYFKCRSEMQSSLWNKYRGGCDQ